MYNSYVAIPYYILPVILNADEQTSVYTLINISEFINLTLLSHVHPLSILSKKSTVPSPIAYIARQ